ncbi:uncharacterized protein LOC141702871 [Apium graveolens]|uniref:uncharacterized protein LOC141702871 n=1 Tax=Apium graveolens TaxID=4045 RepID=UPI003D78C699
MGFTLQNNHPPSFYVVSYDSGSYKYYEDGNERKSKGKVVGLIDKIEKYEFIFIAHLMKVVLGMANSLSQLLQQKDQNIIQVMSMVSYVKKQLQNLRESGWDELLEEVSTFCLEQKINIPNMEDNVLGRIRVVDRISQEMENRFSESSTELLLCVAFLDPRNSFANFDLAKVIRLAELYPQEFSPSDLMELKEELKMWLSEMEINAAILKLQNIGDLAKKMVDVGFDRSFPLVYLQLELIFVLPVATASMERAFSAMNIIKTNLRNKMGDEFFTDCLVCYIEKELFISIENENEDTSCSTLRNQRSGKQVRYFDARYCEIAVVSVFHSNPNHEETHNIKAAQPGKFFNLHSPCCPCPSL